MSTDHLRTAQRHLDAVYDVASGRPLVSGEALVALAQVQALIDIAQSLRRIAAGSSQVTNWRRDADGRWERVRDE